MDTDYEEIKTGLVAWHEGDQVWLEGTWMSGSWRNAMDVLPAGFTIEDALKNGFRVRRNKVMTIRDMSIGERIALIEHIKSACCIECGNLDPRCQCWNDE